MKKNMGLLTILFLLQLFACEAESNIISEKTHYDDSQCKIFVQRYSGAGGQYWKSDLIERIMINCKGKNGYEGTGDFKLFTSRYGALYKIIAGGRNEQNGRTAITIEYCKYRESFRSVEHKIKRFSEKHREVISVDITLVENREPCIAYGYDRGD